MHAVFHFAASISLVDPYDVIRHQNTLVMPQLLRFCATFASKPFHYVSTLAVFPEYISGFPPTYLKAFFKFFIFIIIIFWQL